MSLLDISARKTIFFAAILSVVLLLAVFTFASRPAEAPLDNQSFTENVPEEPAAETPATVQGLSETQQTKTQLDESCSRTTSETSDQSGSAVTNESSTTVNCELDENSGSTNVNITNNVNQTAESGSSTGTSGSASNSNRSNVNINIR